MRHFLSSLNELQMMMKKNKKLLMKMEMTEEGNKCFLKWKEQENEEKLKWKIQKEKCRINYQRIGY